MIKKVAFLFAVCTWNFQHMHILGRGIRIWNPFLIKINLKFSRNLIRDNRIQSFSNFQYCQHSKTWIFKEINRKSWWKSCLKGGTPFCLLKFGNIYLLKSFKGSEIDINYILRQPFTEIIETNAKNGLVPLSHKQCNALFREHMVRLKIISLYIHKDLGS